MSKYRQRFERKRAPQPAATTPHVRFVSIADEPGDQAETDAAMQAGRDALNAPHEEGDTAASASAGPAAGADAAPRRRRREPAAEAEATEAAGEPGMEAEEA